MTSKGLIRENGQPARCYFAGGCNNLVTKSERLTSTAGDSMDVFGCQEHAWPSFIHNPYETKCPSCGNPATFGQPFHVATESKISDHIRYAPCGCVVEQPAPLILAR